MHFGNVTNYGVSLCIESVRKTSACPFVLTNDCKKNSRFSMQAESNVRTEGQMRGKKSDSLLHKVSYNCLQQRGYYAGLVFLNTTIYFAAALVIFFFTNTALNI